MIGGGGGGGGREEEGGRRGRREEEEGRGRRREERERRREEEEERRREDKEKDKEKTCVCGKGEEGMMMNPTPKQVFVHKSHVFLIKKRSFQTRMGFFHPRTKNVSSNKKRKVSTCGTLLINCTPTYQCNTVLNRMRSRPSSAQSFRSIGLVLLGSSEPQFV